MPLCVVFIILMSHELSIFDCVILNDEKRGPLWQANLLDYFFAGLYIFFIKAVDPHTDKGIFFVSQDDLDSETTLLIGLDELRVDIYLRGALIELIGKCGWEVIHYLVAAIIMRGLDL